MPHLTAEQYGKTRVRLMQVLRGAPQHTLIDLNVSVLMKGDFAAAYTEGDNSNVLATDTMKNMVYVVARKNPIRSPEDFSRDLSQYFLERFSQIETVTIDIDQKPWARIGPHGAAFVVSGEERRTAARIAARDGGSLFSGIRKLNILKTGQSGFSGFLRDEYTTLPETSDRLLGTEMDAQWQYTADAADFNVLHEEVRATLLTVFAEHNSLSVQHTLYAMAKAVLDKIAVVNEIHLAMPNKHCLLFDLARFGLDNPNEIFVPTEEPSGYIEASLRR